MKVDMPSLEAVRREHVMRVVAHCRGNRVSAARILGIDRKTVHRMIQRWEQEDAVRAVSST